MRRVRPEPSEAIRAARRLLEGDSRVRIVGDLLWDEEESGWAFPIELSIESADTSLIPSITRWYLVISPRYPWGTVEVYPAKDGGIEKTFPHQNPNGPGEANSRWRTGDLCLRDPGFILRRAGDDPEPNGEPNRLMWYVDRTVEWLQQASRGALLKSGDYFELPKWDSRCATVAFAEDESTHAQWAASNAFYGTVELVALGKGSPHVARRFFSDHRTEVVAPAWGAGVREAPQSAIGAWIRLPELPVLTPYQAPTCWEELFGVMRALGVTPETILPKAMAPLRDGKPHLVLIGFPIPRRVGEKPVVMHWQPLMLPALSSGANPRKGFRTAPSSCWLADSQSVFAGKKPIGWATGENWSETQLRTRGQLSTTLQGKRVLLLGGGAIGSVIAELLVRGGVRRVCVVDADSVSAGNLTRHTLGLDAVGDAKAKRLAARLNLLSPFADVAAVVGTYPNLGNADRKLVDDCSLVLDCCGADDVLQALSDEARASAADYFSISMGRGAKRLYLYGAHGTTFPGAAFHESISPWLARDKEEWADKEFEWEGIGCWHPVFPATAEQVTSLAAAAVAELDARIGAGETEPTLTVFERGIGRQGAGQVRKVTPHG